VPPVQTARRRALPIRRITPTPPNLHDAGDAAVVIRVSAYKIRGLSLDKIHVRLQDAHVLKLEQRRLDELA
jgi:hypothetical protein